MTFWKSQSFKALQRAWYQRLEDEGFQDQEEIIGDEMMLKQTAAHVYKDADDLVATSKASYFALLSAGVQNNVFRNDIDRMILTLFADGAKIKYICEFLERSGNARCRKTVRSTIRKYEMLWGMRVYTPMQLNKLTLRTA